MTRRVYSGSLPVVVRSGFSSALEEFNRLYNAISNGRDVTESKFRPIDLSLTQSNFPYYNSWIDKETRELTFEFALAGFDKDEIEVSFEDDCLVLELKPEVDEDAEETVKYLKHGIRKSKQTNYYKVPFSMFNVSKVEAEFKDGILKVVVPAREETLPTKVSIK